jgi:hypothetical protein
MIFGVIYGAKRYSLFTEAGDRVFKALSSGVDRIFMPVVTKAFERQKTRNLQTFT